MTDLVDPDIAKQVYLKQGIGSVQSPSESDLFVRECLSWLTHWLRKNTKIASDAEAFCAFMFSAEAPLGSLVPGSALSRAFKVTYDPRIGGKVFECSANLERVHAAPIPESSIADFLAWYEKRPASALVVFLPHQRAALVLPPGGDVNMPVRFDLPDTATTPKFDFSQLEGLLEKFFEKHLSTHQANLKIWLDATKRELRRDPEELIQGILMTWLELMIAPSRTALVKAEVANRRGREDVEVIRFNGTEFEFGLIELKVLFPKYTQKKNLEWALAGVTQLKNYRSTIDQPVPVSLVACYDGRKSDAAMPEVQQAAAAEGMAARRYFMETPGCKRCTAFNT